MGGVLYVVVFFFIDICDLAGLFLLESSLFLKSMYYELKTDGSVEIGEGLWSSNMYSFILILPLSYPSITSKAVCGPNPMRTSLYFLFIIMPS